ncbi:MAG: dUTPase [Eubacteriales bacterium]|nr:dUTPase [Clostridia bacterium]MDY5754299.1 dUTPase [Eubacteriales bacterium]
MDDKLDVIFSLQNALDRDIEQRRGLEGISREEWLQKDAIAIFVELGELLCEVNYKWWKNKKPVNEDAAREELVDVLHFLISMCIRMGMTADDLYNGYVSKNKENFDRQYGRSQKQGYSPDEV